jgi:hypothetical protein
VVVLLELPAAGVVTVVRRFRREWMQANMRIMNDAGTVMVSRVSFNMISLHFIICNLECLLHILTKYLRVHWSGKGIVINMPDCMPNIVLLQRYRKKNLLILGPGYTVTPSDSEFIIIMKLMFV